MSEANPLDFNAADYPLKRNWLNMFQIRWAGGWMQKFWGIHAVGLENIPQKKPFIICANHQSLIDCICVAPFIPWPARRDLFVFFRHELLSHPFYAGVGKTLNGIPLRRNGDFRDSLHRAEEMLNAGGILLIYPEGTRTKDGTVHAFHEGFAYLAKSTHADVLPVKLEGAFDVWPFNKQASFFTKRSVKVTFYPAFHPDSYSAHELTEAVQNIYIK